MLCKWPSSTPILLPPSPSPTSLLLFLTPSPSFSRTSSLTFLYLLPVPLPPSPLSHSFTLLLSHFFSHLSVLTPRPSPSFSSSSLLHPPSLALLLSPFCTYSPSLSLLLLFLTPSPSFSRTSSLTFLYLLPVPLPPSPLSHSFTLLLSHFFSHLSVLTPRPSPSFSSSSLLHPPSLALLLSPFCTYSPSLSLLSLSTLPSPFSPSLPPSLPPSFLSLISFSDGSGGRETSSYFSSSTSQKRSGLQNCTGWWESSEDPYSGIYKK